MNHWAIIGGAILAAKVLSSRRSSVASGSGAYDTSGGGGAYVSGGGTSGGGSTVSGGGTTVTVKPSPVPCPKLPLRMPPVGFHYEDANKNIPGACPRYVLVRDTTILPSPPIPPKPVVITTGTSGGVGSGGSRKIVNQTVNDPYNHFHIALE